MKTIIIDKVYNKENHEEVVDDLDRAFMHNIVNFDSHGVLKGNLRIIMEYSIEEEE